MSGPSAGGGAAIVTLSEQAVAGISHGPSMFTGQGWRAFTTNFQPGSANTCSIYERVYISDPYWTTNQRFLFANWFLNTSSTNQETANTNPVQIDIVTMVFTDVSGTQRTLTLTFGGSQSITLTANGGATPQAWTDAGCQPYLVPPSSKVIVRCHRTLITPATDYMPAQVLLAFNPAIGERIQSSSTSLVSLATAGGISTTIPSSSIQTYGFGPIAGVAQGWDGREIPFLAAGTSIEHGQGENRFWSQPMGYSHHCGEAGWFGRGMASTANGAQRLPNVNWSIPGGSLGGINGTGSTGGIFYRQAAIALLAGQRLPFTCVVCSLGTNDSINTTANWMTLFKNCWVALKTAWPLPLIQSEMIPRVTSTDGFQTTTNQSPASSAFAYPAGAAWQLNDWIRGIPSGSPASNNGGYIDRSFSLSDAYSNVAGGGVRGTWNVTPPNGWTATTTASSAVGAGSISLSAGAPAGAIMAILDGTGGYEQAGFYSSAYGGTSNVVYTTNTLLYAHASGVTVKLAPSFEGTHPGAFLNQLVADGAVANAKLQGVFRF